MSISAQYLPDISSLPVPFTKFEGNKSEHLGQLFVTPVMIANKIKKMKDNKSPGVDGIPPNCLRKLLSKLVHHLQLWLLEPKGLCTIFICP